MAHARLLFGAVFVTLLLVAAPAHAALSLPTGFEERTIASGLTKPTAVVFAPDGRIFVAEDSGRVWVITAAGGSLATLLLDISAHVVNNGDRGLLGLALDRDFATNGVMYLLYTYAADPLNRSGPQSSRLTKVTVAADNTAGPETVLLGKDAVAQCPLSNTNDCIPSDGGSHSIGTVKVDPVDGTLWLGSGDASDYNIADPMALRAQNEISLAGKIMHVDTSGNGLPGHPFCPTDTDLTHNCTKVYAKGFRNPFRFNLGGPTGVIVGDVGWNTYEEMNLVQKGGNYGWPCWEGNTKPGGYSSMAGCQSLYTAGGVTGPDHSYTHYNAAGTLIGGAVIGGPQYTATAYPTAYRGDIFFGDYGQGWIRRLRLDSQGKVASVADFAYGFFGVQIVTAPDGDLVWMDYAGGAVKRIRYALANGSPVARITANPTFGASPLTVQFSGTTSTDPDSDPLQYDWDFGDGSPHSTASAPSHDYTGTQNRTATLTVTDGRGGTDTTSVTISPGNTPPTASISGPTTSRAGDIINLTAAASDAEDGALSGTALSWTVRLRHIDHLHNIASGTGSAIAFTATADHDANTRYEITLTATDARGLTDQTTYVVTPETVQLTLDSSPAGAPLDYGGNPVTAPTTLTTAIGYRTTLSAADSFTTGGKTYSFTGWSDGGAASHQIVVPTTAGTLTATYQEVAPEIEKALGHTATSSSIKGAGYEPGKALDQNNTTTRWSSQFGVDNQWWQVDLGSVRKVSRVTADWFTSYATRYLISVSTDGTSFTQVADVTNNATGLKSTSFAATDARYVRITGVTRAVAQYGISFWEARVYGPADAGGPPPPPPPPPPGEVEKALGHTATSSSIKGAGFEAAKALDQNNTTTRWSSKFGVDGEWWQVDLGSVRKVARVTADWFTSYATRYRISVSTDGTTFTQVADVTNGAAGLKSTSFTAVDARYVRITGVTRAVAQYGISFWEARVYGPADGPPPPPEVEKALGQTATSSSIKGVGYEPAKALDQNNTTTRWSSQFGVDNQWWQVDLGAVRKVSRVTFDWYSSYATRYLISVSTDGTTFTQVADVTNNTAALKSTSFPAVDARYVRITGVTRALAQYGISFWEARVYGPADV